MLQSSSLIGRIMVRDDVTYALGFDPAYVTATGTSVSRSLASRAAEVANILDYFPANSDDAAQALRAAIATGKKVIYVPPGTYQMRSVLETFGSATNPSCVEVRGLSDVWIVAYGATFQVAVSGPVPATTFSFTGNAKNCGLLGGTLIGSFSGLQPGDENVAINFDSVTGITVRDVKITGKHTAAFSGVYIYDSVIDNVQSFNTALGLDLAHTENLTIRGCRFEADPTFPVAGINHHYDVPTLGDNVVTTEVGALRTLRGGQSNRLHVFDSAFVGYGNSIAIEDMQGAVISRCTLLGTTATSAYGTAGVLLGITSTDAIAAGVVNKDTTIENCEITGHGTTAGGGIGGGVLLDHATSVAIRDSRIFDNYIYGVTAPTLVGLANLSSTGNDFTKRTTGVSPQQPYHPNLYPYIGANFGDGVDGYALTVHADATYFQKPWNTTAVTAGGAGYLANNTSFYWGDTFGTAMPIIGVGPDNASFVRSAADVAYVTLQNASGQDCLIAGTAGVRATKGMGFWNTAIPAIQPPAPTTLNDVIAIIRGCGLSA
jgi:hypothetical protein